MLKNSDRAYGRLALFFHWTMAAVIIAALLLIEFKGLTPRGSPQREQVMALHMSLGLTALLLILPRLLWRTVNRTPVIEPPLPPQMHRWQQMGHGLLYVLMLATPILGWVMQQLGGRPVMFFGNELPAWLTPDKALGHTLRELHELAGTVLMWLIGLHIVATAWHHWLRRDNTLWRMLGRSGRTG